MLVIGCWLSVADVPGRCSVAPLWACFGLNMRDFDILRCLARSEQTRDILAFFVVSGYRLSVVGLRLLVIGCRLVVAGCRLLVIGCRSDRLQVSGPRFGPFSACLLLPVGNVPASQKLSKKGPFRALCAGSILVHAESWANVVYDPSRTFLRDIYRVIAAVREKVV